ncbi:hypothetical protein O6P37_09450 [Mycobacterium sp. CPCC 205372]|uniref:Integral membrane protein n=1 Tax=Mycobacterium hippophais TaxID=3016340 RepID=A0ABT4PRA6_9MYCO|nr:hypothetical protein [Mycobacterium hippophais]MCZ8379085.1 hypothetical protein [Mycobacterium hippophais]
MFRSNAFEAWSPLAQGAGFALAADMAMARFLPRRRTAVAAVGLVAAAAVYPLSRRRWGIDTREAITLTAACAVASAATWLPAGTARRVVGVGWAAHAVYDAVFTHDASITRLPPTYAAACAGADIAMGARLLLVRP